MIDNEQQTPGLLRQLRSFGAEVARQVLEKPLYGLGIHAYAVGVSVAGPFLDKAAKMARGHREIWKKLAERPDPEKGWIWVHAASLGEFEQGRPLMERIRSRFPDKRIALTFFSPSGYEVRKDYPGADLVCYLPYDTARNARRWVETLRPEKAIFVKYEIWRNYLDALRTHGVPTYLVSAIFHPGHLFFRKRGSWYRAWLRGFTRIFVQNEESRRLLAGVGFDNVDVTGDTRFDRVADILAAKKEIPELERFRKGAPLTIMAGSSWPQDEEVYVPWINTHPEVKLVVAPHEFDARRLETLKERFTGGAALLSEVRKEPQAAEGKQVLIIDCFGLLSSAYAYADIAYIGGAFGAGLHNVNEAAVYGIPVVFGPKYDKFQEAKDLTANGGGITVTGRAELEKTLDMILDDGERRRRGTVAGDYIKSKLGASDNVFRAIFG